MPRRAHAANHLQHPVEGAAVLHLAPRRAHAEAGRARFLRLAGGRQHLVGLHHPAGIDLGLVARRLRAVGAVLGAAAGLDRQQRAELHLARIVVAAVHLCGAEDQIEKRCVVEIGDRGQRPLLALRRRRRHGLFVTPLRRRGRSGIRRAQPAGTVHSFAYHGISMHRSRASSGSAPPRRLRACLPGGPSASRRRRREGLAAVLYPAARTGSAVASRRQSSTRASTRRAGSCIEDGST